MNIYDKDPMIRIVTETCSTREVLQLNSSTLWWTDRVTTTLSLNYIVIFFGISLLICLVAYWLTYVPVLIRQ